MSTHTGPTPGPWYADRGHIYSRAHELNYQTNPQDAPYTWRVVSQIHGKTDEELAANEAVIAAAFEMLIALRMVWNSIDRVNHAAAEVVRAALLKAEGQS